MRFVKALCEQKNVPFYGGRVDVPGYARAHGCGLEEAARTLRYDFLEKTGAVGAGRDRVGAHHRGSGGTVLLHAARGSDIRGLCAMRWRRGSSFVRCWTRSRRRCARICGASVSHGARTKPTPARITRETGFAVRRCLRWRRLIPDAQGALARLAASAQRDEDYFAKRLDELGGSAPLKLVNGACLPRKTRGSCIRRWPVGRWSG